MDPVVSAARQETIEKRMNRDVKNALVTGGASGIGRGICLRLARDGVNVIILDIDHQGAREVAEECRALGRKSLAFDVDVAEGSQINSALAEVHRRIGAIHILVNSAGIAEYVPIARLDEQRWNRMIDVHLKGTFNCTKAVLKEMTAVRWGRIVNITSLAGLTGVVGMTHYSAAKAGIIGFTKALAQELGPKGITVNAIAPGLVETAILRKSIPNEGRLEDFRSAVVGRTPVGRAGTPQDIASACAYLVSEEASFLTGQVLSPNGGLYT
jgi:NAD(P)-dependent dehydrogenase (short-subunit alcohol dehydrogenase family)